MNLKYIPRQLQDKEMVKYALTMDPKVISVVPPDFVTVDICQDALRRDSNISIEDLPEHIIEKLSNDFRPKNFINYKPIKLNPLALSLTDVQLVSANERRYPKNLSSGDGPNKKFYYVTDLHLEHQLVEETEDITKLSLSEIKSRIDRKTSELVSSVSADYHSTLLIGGDVADSIKLEALFYKQLTLKWPGNIISVLGNHELWDGDLWGTKIARPIDKIIYDYRKSLPLGTSLLENQLLIYYKGLHKEILDENDILRASTKELTEVCNRSSIIVLGGIGFSGLNPVYNANAGLYRSSVSREEDILRSQRFRSIYEKVLASAKDIPVIVLTHMPMMDWSDAAYNPRWIYVNGHTHQNSRLLDHDGTSVFSDNQIGYAPKVWRLNSFIIDVKRYDPFKDYSDGIHQISREQYVDFNRCQGIAMDSIKYPGDVFVIKYDMNYMFVIKNSKNLYLLEGGRRHKLDHDIDYYFENLPLYIKKVRNAFMPYQKAISMLSNEVKEIGGSGKVHGCIVDIDFFNHIYLNPFDGKISPYFALDTTNKVFFKDVKSLLNSSSFDNKRILRKYSSMSQKGNIPILTHKEYRKQELTAMSEIVLDRSMYEPSRIMRSIQYIFDQNVLRVWKDEVLSISETSPKEMLPNSKKLS
ncbi:hypothetical protein BTI76_05585 [Lactobacillus delbrueckii subsp. bulgaricus]|nr:hypothetical protein [Lactobacillus delbrueckii subsp. bulgaricus]